MSVLSGCYLFKYKRILIEYRIDTVVSDHLRPKPFPDGIRRQTVHFYFNISPYSLVSQKLSRYHSYFHGTGYDAVNGTLGKRVKSSVGATHELRLQQITAPASKKPLTML